MEPEPDVPSAQVQEIILKVAEARRRLRKTIMALNRLESILLGEGAIESSPLEVLAQDLILRSTQSPTDPWLFEVSELARDYLKLLAHEDY